MDLDELDDEKDVRQRTCPICYQEAYKVRRDVFECLECGSYVDIDYLGGGKVVNKEIVELKMQNDRLRDELRVAKDMYSKLYKKLYESPSPLSFEPAYIDAIRRSCLSPEEQREVIVKLQRIAMNKEANFVEFSSDNFDVSNLPYCRFDWANTREKDFYWRDICRKIQSVPLSPIAPVRAGETFTNVSIGVKQMATSSAVFNVTIVGVLTTPLGVNEERVIDSVTGILAPDSQTAAFLAGANLKDELKLKSGEKIVIRSQSY